MQQRSLPVIRPVLDTLWAGGPSGLDHCLGVLIRKSDGYNPLTEDTGGYGATGDRGPALRA